jgi:hypothetical protein
MRYSIYLEFSSVFLVADYIPPQADAGTKTTLNELHFVISIQENAHPQAALLVAGDFNAGKLLFYHISISMLNMQPEGEKNLETPLLHTHLYSTHLTIILSS